MFNKRFAEPELMDDLSLQGLDLKINLDELEWLNRLVGSKKTLLAALNKVYQKHRSYFHTNKVVIMDLGCGGGDLLRAINDWAVAKNVAVELVGIDANPFMIEYALKKSHSYPNISYKILNILSPEFRELKFDIATLNSFCHHLSDEELVEFFIRITQQSSLAVVINDLQRHWLSYFTIKFLGNVFHFSRLAQHDGPLSVLRAFQRRELISLLRLSKICSYRLCWAWAFRWELIIWCKKNDK